MTIRHKVFSLFLIFSILLIGNSFSASKFNPISGEIIDYTGLTGGTLTDTKYCIYTAATGTIDCTSSGSGSTLPGGNSGEAQYNSSGAFGGVPRTVFTSGGNVGVGTTLAGTGTLEVTKNSTTDLLHVSTVGNHGDIFTITNGGNIGIGTVGPQAAFAIGTGGAFPTYQVSSAGSTNTAGAYTQSGSGTNTLNGLLDANAVVRIKTDPRLLFGSNNAQSVETSADSATADLLFKTASTERVRITNSGTVGIGTTFGGNSALTVMSGNVGIGTWGPRAALEIIGRIKQSVTPTQCSAGQYPLGIDGDLNVLNCTVAGAGGSSQWQTQSGVGVGTVNAVGIGTYTWGSKLSVLGGVGIGTTGSSLYVQNAATTGDLIVEKNIGIGTLSPNIALGVGATNQFKVDSSGNATVGGTLGVTGHTTFEGVTSTGATGTGKIVYDGTPTLVTPVIGLATGTSLALSGNIGVGGGGVSTHPLQVTGAGYVSGNFGIGADGTATRPLTVYQTGTNTGILTNITDDSNTLQVSSHGALGEIPAGILLTGSTTPLNIGPSQLTPGTQKFVMSYSYNTGSANLSALEYSNTATTAYATMALVKSGGNVGINTSSPGSSLSTLGGVSVGAYATNTAPIGGLIVSGNVGIGTTFGNSSLSVMSGNVGIGTWNPTQALQIIGRMKQSTAPTLCSAGSYALGVDGNLDAAGCTVSSGTNFWTSFAAAGNVGIGTVTNSVGIGTFMGSAALAVMPPQDGHQNVGIGTWNPRAALEIVGRLKQSVTPTQCSAGNYPLGVDGDLNVLNCTAAGAGGSSQWNTLSGVGLGTSDAVGIGTSTFSQKLTVVGNVGIGTVQNGPYVNQAATTQGVTIQGNVGLGTWDARNSLIVYSNGITGTGNVGLGTLAPGVMLDINGSSRYSNGGDFILQGNMGLGTSIPMNTLAIQGAVAIGSAAFAGTANPDITGVMISGNLGIGTTKTTTSALTVMSGNVGIGTWSPVGPFEIKGGATGSVKTGANTACNTTCGTSSCLFGEDTSVIGTVVACTDATADVCVCLGR